MSEHSMRRARMFTMKHESTGFLVGILVLLVLVAVVGFIGGTNIPFATYMGWGAAYAGGVGFILGVYVYAVRRRRGRHDYATYSGIAGFVVFAFIEAVMPFGSAILNFASGSDFFGWIVNLILGVVFLLMLGVSYYNVKRTDLR